MKNIPGSINLGHEMLALFPEYSDLTHMAISTSDNLGLLRALLIDIRTLCLPLFAKNIFRKSARTSDVGWVAFVQDIHDLIRNYEGLVLQGCVPRQGVYELPQRGEIPEQSPCYHDGEASETSSRMQACTYHLDWERQDQQMRAENIYSSTRLENEPSNKLRKRRKQTSGGAMVS